MQERLVSGQQRHGWLKVLLCSAILFNPIHPDPIRTAAGGYPLDTAQLPVSLQKWSPTGGVPSSGALESFKRGMDHYYAKRYAAALESFPDEQTANAIGDYILFYRAKSNVMLKRDTDALTLFRRMESRYPDSPLLRESLIEQCRILLESNDAKAALTVLNNPKIGVSSEILYYQARAVDLTGQKEKAAELYLRIYSRYPESEFSPLSERYLPTGSFKGARNYAARVQRAETLINSGQLRTARAILLALARFPAPDSITAEKRNLLFGEVEFRMGKTSASIPYLRKVTAADPALHAKALFLEGSCARKLDKEANFIELRDRLLKLYPRSPRAEELCYSVATYFDVNYEAAKSRDAYKVIYESFPKGRYAERALWKMALYPYSLKKYDEALLVFWKYLLAYQNPQSASSAMYWMGRCYEKLGNQSNARYLYGRVKALANESYYGQRAVEAEKFLVKQSGNAPPGFAGLDFKQVAAACDSIQSSPAAMQDPDASGAQVIERARQLLLAGFTDLALTELRWGRTQYPQNDDSLCYIMSRIYTSRQDYNAAISSLRRAFPDYNSRPLSSLPEEVWDMLFPVRYWETISREATGNKTDPNLILGLIRQESSFEERATSKAKALGLMQILPSTGRKLAKQARIPRFTSKKLYYPEINITLGTRYFAYFLNLYGKPELALAAYNAGGSRVERWLQEWGDDDMAEFVEHIPFAETRGYVKQVLSNRNRYGLLTSSGSASTH